MHRISVRWKAGGTWKWTLWERPPLLGWKYAIRGPLPWWDALYLPLVVHGLCQKWKPLVIINSLLAFPTNGKPKGSDMVFHGQLEDETLKGTLIYTDGSLIEWTGVRAPKLEYTENPKWGKTIDLFNGKDLSGWHVDGEKNQWVVKDGVLTSPESGSNLISDETFQDFKLHAEFRFPEGSNSGIYLRGRYEIQIVDSEGYEPSDIYMGGIYGFVEPNENASKPAGEWQTYDITFIGRRVTIVLNGKTVISDTTIPGITGGALDSKEGEPGPFMIQGDHGPIEFRSFEVTPLKK